MKAVLVGLGGFGSGWYRRLRNLHSDIQLIVVDVDPGKNEEVNVDRVPFYTSVGEAIEREKPDMLVNVTPRQAHTAINHLAFDHKLPVFCEKPIADNYKDAIAVVERAEREGIPFMIAENYRAFPIVRKLKQLLHDRSIGDVRTIHCDFYRLREKVTVEPTEVLEELYVHHFDLLRYLTGREVGSIMAVQRHELHLVMDMQAGIQATFRGSTITRGKQTEWSGDWRIEGTAGSLVLEDKHIELTTAEGTVRFDDFSDVDASGPFSEFLASLRENREAETSGKSYLKNQALAHYAKVSLGTNRMVDTSSSWGYGPMVIRNFLEADLKETVSHRGKGTIQGIRLYGDNDFDTPVKFLGYSVIPPGNSIGYHGHRDDEEMYIILEGTGVMTVNGEARPVKAGDVVLNKPWWKHGLENDGSQPLKLIIFEVGRSCAPSWTNNRTD